MKCRMMGVHSSIGKFLDMQTEPKKTPRSKTNSNVAKLTSQLIAEQTTAFLKAGGKIAKIRSGVRDHIAAPEKEKV